MSALSLSTTMTGSPASTLSPLPTSQLTTRPDVIVDESAGIAISVTAMRGAILSRRRAGCWRTTRALAPHHSAASLIVFLVQPRCLLLAQ